MNFGIPFRAPCGGWPATNAAILGSFYQHYLSSEDGFEVYTNTTIVNAMTPGVTTGTQPAYERWANTAGGTGISCETNHCAPVNATCNDWIGTDQTYSSIQYTITPSQVNTAPQSFVDANRKTNFSSCHKRGEKSVAAKRQWHGRWGFLTGQQECDNTHCTSGSTFKHWRAEDLSPQQFKYLTDEFTVQMTAHSTETIKFNDSAGTTHTLVRTVTYGGTASGTMSVDPLSGIRTLSGWSLTGPGDGGAWNITGDSYLLAGAGNPPDPSAIVPVNINYIDKGFPGPYFGESDGAIYVPAYAEALQTWAIFDACGGQINCPGNGSSFSNAITDYASTSNAWHDAAWWQTNLPLIFPGLPAGPGPATTNNWTVSLTDNSLSISGSTVVNVPDPGTGVTTSASMTVNVSHSLSGQNQAVAVYADMKNLLAEFPLNDDTLYPWRTDGKPQIAPLLSRNEVPTNVVPGVILFQVDDLTSPVADANGNAAWTTPFGADGVNPPSGTNPLHFGWTFAPENNDSSGNAYGSPSYGGPAAWVPTYGQINWFDTAAFRWYWPAGYDQSSGPAAGLIQFCDATIQGIPQAAGSQNYFRFDFIDYAACCFTDPDNGIKSMDWYTLGWGMWLEDFNSKSGTQLPANTTQWVDWYQSIDKAPGAGLFYFNKQQAFSPEGCPYTGGALGSGALWGYKYALILSSWPSVNGARPAGNDKFAYDETKVYGATNVSGSGVGSIWQLMNNSGTVISAMDTSGIWGGPVVGGFYNIASLDPGTGQVTLGSQVYNVPSGWQSNSGDDAICFGQLRFPNCASLLGAIPIMPVADIGGHQPYTTGWTPTFQFISAQPNFGQGVVVGNVAMEQVDIYDANMNLLSGNVTATALNDTEFTLPLAVANAANVMIHGAAPWYMNDTQPKGDFVTLDWTLDYRTNGENTRLAGITDCSGAQVTLPARNHGYSEFSQTQRCLPFQIKYPSVVCLSPNGETFPNGVTIPFPDTFTLDEIYGSYWVSQIQSTINDIFWQTPHAPISLMDNDPDSLTYGDSFGAGGVAAISWQMDDGTCHANGGNGSGGYNAFYPFAPQIEARLSMPGNYGAAQNESPPPLPAGVTIGWLSPVTYTGNDVIYPMGPSGYDQQGMPQGSNTDYLMWARFCSSACAGQYTIYKTYAARCAGPYT